MKVQSAIEKGKEERSKRFKICRYISLAIWVIYMIAVIFLVYTIVNSGMVPMKYEIIVGVVAAAIAVGFGAVIIRKKHGMVPLIIMDVIMAILIGAVAFVVPKVNSLDDFLDKNMSTDYKIDTYYVLAKKDSSFGKVKDLEGHTVNYINDRDDDKLTKKINKEIPSVSLTKEKDTSKGMSTVATDPSYVLVANSGYYDQQESVDENYPKKVKILGKFTIKTKIKKRSGNTDVTKDPFVVYVSGIDTRSGQMDARSLSDVNILMAVNPKKKKILMVHIPRDYYVKIHGTNDTLKDKLTHAGVRGGVEMSMSTIEDLMDTKINYYARVNFNAVVNLVDALGGIDLNNDQSYSFSCWTNRSCVFRPGINSNVSGKCALAFARERHAYQTGDRHRGENQEQVITKVLNKMTSSKTVLSKYNDILNSLNGTFETSLSSDDISKLVKMQLNDMSSWDISTYNVDGTTGMNYTASYPSQKLSVMEPNQETVETAKKKIDEITGED